MNEQKLLAYTPYSLSDIPVWFIFSRECTTLNLVLQCIHLFSYCLTPPPSKLLMSYVGVCHFSMFFSSPRRASCPYTLQILIEWVEFVLIEWAPLQVRKPTAGKIAYLLHSRVLEQHAAGSWLEFRLYDLARLLTQHPTHAVKKVLEVGAKAWVGSEKHSFLRSQVLPLFLT